MKTENEDELHPLFLAHAASGVDRQHASKDLFFAKVPEKFSIRHIQVSNLTLRDVKVEVMISDQGLLHVAIMPWTGHPSFEQLEERDRVNSSATT